MVYETEEIPNPYMERSSPGIFEAIQIHAGDSPRLNDPLVHEEETRQDYKKYAIRWKNVASMV